MLLLEISLYLHKSSLLLELRIVDVFELHWMCMQQTDTDDYKNHSDLRL